ncbi:MAG TPA: FAD-dependent oxidoreductase [Blastocatellia bacterium]|nr:FAD-dependent oxidoreductase [Blastocatellia bacterium]
MKDAEAHSGHLVVVVGAGPAGIYGARKLAEAGHQVVVINRDVKPGGLAEYGIYFNKYRMKEGIRQQFRKILSDPRVHYLGNVRVGRRADLTLDELHELLNPAALVIAAGAQGTKLLGLPGERAAGVHHAKDLVYHYNELPPFSQQKFEIGDRVAIIGVGNVMVDVAHYLVHEKKVSEVIAVARRGPAQRAYTDHEMEAVAANIDTDDLRRELERIRARIEPCGDEIEAVYQALLKPLKHPSKEGESPTKLKFRFLCSPTEIIHNSDGRVSALRIEDMELVPKGDDFSARGLGTFTDIEADTIIFAVGDSTDPDFGLPNGKAGYATRPDPDPERPGDEAYQVFDPQTGEVVTGAFVIGWSRLASDGLVGKARQDGERGVQVVNHYLSRVPPGTAEDAEVKIARLISTLGQRGVRTVNYADVQRLERIEQQEAQQRGLEYFRFASNEEMFTHLNDG